MSGQVLHWFTGSSPLQPSLRLPVPAPLSCSVHISHFWTRFPAPSPISSPISYMLSGLRCAHFGTFAALTREWVRPTPPGALLEVLRSIVYYWNRLILYFPQSPKALQSESLCLFLQPTLYRKSTCAFSEKATQARTDNIIN
jgi:hypothetical protein